MRAGLILVPVGLVNLVHESPTFLTVDRPLVDQLIVPSTWRELGAGIYGQILEGLHYQIYALTGLSADGFSQATLLRGGRSTEQQIVPYVHYEYINTAAALPEVLAPALEGAGAYHFLSAGAAYRPRAQVAFKFEYRRTLAGRADGPAGLGGTGDRFSFGVGLMF